MKRRSGGQFGGALTTSAIARALAAKGLTDAQARAAVGGAATIDAGLRAIGLLGAAPAPTPTPTPTPTLRAVGTGGRNATGIKALTGTFQKVRNRSTTFIRSATTFVEFRFPNWYSEDGSGGGRSLYNTYAAGTTAKAQFDIYSNVAAGGSPPSAAGDKTSYGTVNGAAGNVGVQIGGGTAEPWVTCRLNAADVGLSVFPEGMCICCLIEVDFPTTGASIPLTDSRQDNSSSTPGENYYWGGTSSIGIFGPIGANGGSQKGYAWRPFVVLGDGTKEAIIAGGDSNTAGQGAGKPAGDGQTNAAGMAAKGLWNSGKAYTVFGKSGDRIAYWAALPVEDIRYQVMKWFDRALLNFGTNDLSDTTSTTDTAASTITTNASRDVRGKIRAANPNIRIYQAFILPRVTQVNGFTTLAAQTVQLGFADAHAARPAFEASLTADVGAAGRNLDGTFNVRAAVASPVEPDKWDVDGATVHFNEADGVHTNATGSGKAAVPYTEVANR